MKRMLCACLTLFPWIASAGKIYWTDRNMGLVQRANLDGSELETLITTESTNLRGIAVDIAGGKLYFADNQQPKTISRANLDGTMVEVLIEGFGFPADVTLDLANEKLYWCDQQRNVIERANLDGSERQTVVETSSPYYLELDLPNNQLYWGDFGVGTIQRVSLNGGTPESIFSGQPRIRGVKLDRTRGEIVWANRQSNHVQRRKIAGGEPVTVIGDLDTPHGLVIDPAARKAYWCDTGTDNHNQGGRAINRTDLDVGGPLETVAELSQPWDADLDLSTTTYQAYVARYFRIGRPASETAIMEDFDGDGFAQLIEYGLASHPERAELVPNYAIESEDGQPMLVYERFAGVTDMEFLVEVSSDLDVWKADASGTPEIEALPHGREKVRVPIQGAAKHARLRITQKE